MIDSHYTQVASYQGCDTSDPWQTYAPSAPAFANDLTTLNFSQGFWINMTVSDTLVVTGTIPHSASIPLCTGWNLVGYPFLDAQPVQDALASIAGTYSLVRAYDAREQSDPWKLFDTSAPPFANDLMQMRAGLGYWINASQDVDWTIEN